MDNFTLIQSEDKKKISKKDFRIVSKRKPNKSQLNNLIWDGLNMKGKRVSSGLYFIEASGKEKTLRHKIIFIKDE